MYTSQTVLQCLCLVWYEDLNFAFEVFCFLQYCFFVYDSPDHKGGKEEIKCTEGEPGGPLAHMVDLKSYCYS